MAKAKSAVATHRALMKRKGFVRVEVKIRRADVGLIRRVASALCDPARQGEARSLLRRSFVERSNFDLKKLLQSAPLDGIDSARSSDLGREVDL